MLSLLTKIGILCWTDVLELAVLVGIVYGFGRWLKHDRSQRLLLYFYAGGVVCVLAVLFDLQAIVAFYKTAWPILVVLFIVVHQKSLQQNYIAARTIEADAVSVDHDWIRVIMRAAFKAVQRKKNLFFVIEGKQYIREYITTPVVFQSPVQEPVVDMIVESALIYDNSLVLLNQLGTLVALNGQWSLTEPPELAAEYTQLPLIQQQALFLTHKTDMLVFFVDAESKRLTVMAQGTLVKNLTSDTAELVINQYIRKQRLVKTAVAPTKSSPSI
jgi:DNA integrity scanning protein DisA with diadenylate cyclase activity